jgi:hypothetical protein
MTSLFPFIHHLKQHDATDAAAIETLLSQHSISSINDIWGDGRTSIDNGAQFGIADYISPVHAELAVSHDTSHSVCTTRRFANTVGGSYTSHNRLGTRRFVRFTVNAGGTWRIRLAGNHVMRDSDPDFVVFRQGETLLRAWADSSSATGNGSNIETGTVTLSQGEIYVIEVMDWFNVDDNSSTGGDICLQLSFDYQG